MLSPKKGTNNMQLPSNVTTTTTPCFHNKVWQVSKQVWKKVKWGEDRKLELNWAGIILLWCPSHLLKWQQLWCVMIVTFFDLSAHVWLSFSYGLYGVCVCVWSQEKRREKPTKKTISERFCFGRFLFGHHKVCLI